VIQKITKASGIEKLVKFVAGEDCGCDARKDKLNKLFPRVTPLCLTEKEYEWLTDYKARATDDLNGLDANQLAHIWTRIFQNARLYKPCSCSPHAWRTLIDEVMVVYETYENKI
jgi:hypothetical protein